MQVHTELPQSQPIITEIHTSQEAELPTATAADHLFSCRNGGCLISKLGAETNERLWIRHFFRSDSDAGIAIAPDRSGNIYAGGTTTSRTSEACGIFVIKLTNDRSRVLWPTLFGQPNTPISALAIRADDMIVVGSTRILDVFENARRLIAKVHPVSNSEKSSQEFYQEFYEDNWPRGGGSTCKLPAECSRST